MLPVDHPVLGQLQGVVHAKGRVAPLVLHLIEITLTRIRVKIGIKTLQLGIRTCDYGVTVSPIRFGFLGLIHHSYYTSSLVNPKLPISRGQAWKI